MHRLIALTLLSTLMLASCGVRGKLKTPPPVFGDKDRAPVERPQPELPNDGLSGDTDDEFDDLEDEFDDLEDDF